MAMLRFFTASVMNIGRVAVDSEVKAPSDAALLRWTVFVTWSKKVCSADRFLRSSFINNSMGWGAGKELVIRTETGTNR